MSQSKYVIFYINILTFYVIFYIVVSTKIIRVKRKDIIKKLTKAGFTFVEGANHTKAYDSQGIYRATIGRHPEIKERIVKKIEKQTGIKLR